MIWLTLLSVCPAVTGQPGTTTTGTWGNRCCFLSASKGRRPTSSWRPSPCRLTLATSNATSTLGSTLNPKPTSPRGWVYPTCTICGLRRRDDLRWLTILHAPFFLPVHTKSQLDLLWSFCTCKIFSLSLTLIFALDCILAAMTHVHFLSLHLFFILMHRTLFIRSDI